MAYNKYFFNLNKLNVKEGASLFKSKNNTTLTLTNNLFFKDDFYGVITSSNNRLYITGNLHLSNNLTSSNLKTDKISFDNNDTISIFSNNFAGNILTFNNRCELTGSADLKDKIISTGITGSLTEIASGKNLIIGGNGVSATKTIDPATGLQYYEIATGDSNEEEVSPINTSIYLKVIGGTAEVSQSGLNPNEFNSIKNLGFLKTVGDTHELKIHKFYEEIFKGERLVIILNLMEANNNTKVDLDFTFSDPDLGLGPGEGNHFNIGNDIKCSMYFKEGQNHSQEVNYVFDSFDVPGKNKYEFMHLNNSLTRWEDNTASINANRLIIKRDNSFKETSESFFYIGNKVNSINSDTEVTFHSNHHYFSFI